MSRWTSLALVVGVAGCARDGQLPEQQDWSLPEDPRAVVLSLDFQGGLSVPRRNAAPYLSVHADGTVRAVEPLEEDLVYEDRLSSAQLEELVSFVVDEQRLLEIDLERLRTQIDEAAKQRPRPAQTSDTSDTVIRVALADRERELRLQALSERAQRYPEIASLQRLRAVVERLNTLRWVVLAGGEQAVTELLAAANAKLAAEFPADAPLRREELGAATDMPDGGKWVHFRRTTDGVTLAVTLKVSPAGEVEVQIEHRR